jgi:hypothetical protein
MPQSIISLIQVISELVNIFSFLGFSIIILFQQRMMKIGKGHPNNRSVDPNCTVKMTVKEGLAQGWV